MTRIIAIASQKGGTGKTATTQNLGWELAEAGQKTLLVDFDPQANLTSGLGLNPYEDRQTIYHAMRDLDQARSAVHPLTANLDLLPANLDLAGAEIEMTADPFSDRNGWLRTVLNYVNEDQSQAGKGEVSYDFILIDCPPSLGFFTANALFAANEIIVPLQCEPYSLEAMRQLAGIVKKVQQQNRALRWGGIALTMYDRRITLTEAVEEEARGRFGDLVFETVIPRNVSIAEASAAGEPVSLYDKRASGAKAYRKLAEEVLSRG